MPQNLLHGNMNEAKLKDCENKTCIWVSLTLKTFQALVTKNVLVQTNGIKLFLKEHSYFHQIEFSPHSKSNSNSMYLYGKIFKTFFLVTLKQEFQSEKPDDVTL